MGIQLASAYVSVRMKGEQIRPDLDRVQQMVARAGQRIARAAATGTVAFDRRSTRRLVGLVSLLLGWPGLLRWLPLREWRSRH